MHLSLIALSITCAALACDDGSSIAPAHDTTNSADSSRAEDDTRAPDHDAEASDEISDAPDAVADTTDTTPQHTGDTGPRDVFNPQPDAWTTTWTRTLGGAGARVLGLRYIGGQSAAGLIALFELDAGAAVLDAGDGAGETLAGDARRLVVASLDPTTGALVDTRTIPLDAGATVDGVTKAPNGFAVALAAPVPRVVLAQVFAGVVRATLLEPLGDGARIGLPEAADLALSTSGGATTALALTLSDATALRVTVIDGESSALEPPIVHGARLGFLALAAPTAEAALPAEGTTLVALPDLDAARVWETPSGPVLTVTAAGATTIRDISLAAGQPALLIGAVPSATADEADDADGVVPIALWSGDDAGHMEVVQIASAGFGGLALAGLGDGAVTLGDATTELASQGFIATLGSGGGLVYSAPECERVLGLGAGSAFRILKTTCDFEGEGPALALTFIGSDFGDYTEPVDLLLAPIASSAAASLVSGLVSLSVPGGRAYGGLFDLGEGPRLLLVREDGQLYDSGVLPLLVGDGPANTPLLFQLMRLGGGGGGGGGNNPTTNGVVFATPRQDGVLLGRARIDLDTIIR